MLDQLLVVKAVAVAVAQVIMLGPSQAMMVVLVALAFSYLQYFVILPILMEHLDQVDQPSG